MSNIIEDLQSPIALPDKTRGVTVVQTHISIVFVADEFVYKVKKPVDFGFLDFSTLEKREYYCHREVELNRRLTKGIYLDVLPVTMDEGKYSLRGISGEAVEYAVRMKRIPDEKLMKSLFARDEITQNHLKRIAEVLAEFPALAQPTPEVTKPKEPTTLGPDVTGILGGLPVTEPAGLTKDEIQHLGKREQTALRAAQKRGLKVGFKQGAPVVHPVLFPCLRDLVVQTHDAQPVQLEVLQVHFMAPPIEFPYKDYLIKA